MKLFALCLGVLLFLGIIGSSRVTPALAAGSNLPAGFTRVLHATGLNAPTAFAFQGGKIFVTEKQGTLRIIGRKGNLVEKPYLELHVTSDKERGLLGVAIDPKYRKNHFVYVYYTTGPGAKQYGGTPVNRVSRFTTKNGKGKHEKILLDNIPSDLGYHNGGDLHFGFDGKLYVTIGDGGVYWSASRELDNVRGKILRLNRDGSAPTDNPFYNTPGIEPRIFAYGFRNPFRLAPRPANHTYLVGDVGLDSWEELDSIQAGGDYGWYEYEGPCVYAALPACDPEITDFKTTIPPIHAYPHATAPESGATVIAGAFPKNSNYPAPYGDAFFYGDWVAGWVHALSLDANNRVTAQSEFDTLSSPVSFAVGPAGNLYVASFFEGSIYKYIYTP